MNTIISLTTIPTRLPHIKPVIESLKVQGFPVHLWIPKVYRRFSIEFDGNVPDFCEGIKVAVVDDCGPITKLLPALRARFERIITVDDDHVYSPKMAKNLVEYSDNDPTKAYSHLGRMLPNGEFKRSRPVYSYKVKKPTPVDMVEGAFGAIYLSSFFDDTIFEEYQQSPTNDDITISAHLKHKGIEKLVVPGGSRPGPGKKFGDHHAVSEINMGCDLNSIYLQRAPFRILTERPAG